MCTAAPAGGGTCCCGVGAANGTADQPEPSGRCSSSWGMLAGSTSPSSGPASRGGVLADGMKERLLKVLLGLLDPAGAGADAAGPNAYCVPAGALGKITRSPEGSGAEGVEAARASLRSVTMSFGDTTKMAALRLRKLLSFSLPSCCFQYGCCDSRKPRRPTWRDLAGCERTKFTSPRSRSLVSAEAVAATWAAAELALTDGNEGATGAPVVVAVE